MRWGYLGWEAVKVVPCKCKGLGDHIWKAAHLCSLGNQVQALSISGIWLDLDLDLGDKSPVSEQEKCPRESCSQSKTEIATATSKVDNKRSLLFRIIRGSFGCETLEENASNVFDLLPFSPASVIVEEGEGERFTCFLISSLVWFWPAKLFKLFVGLRLTYHPSLHLLLKFSFELFLSCFFSLIQLCLPAKNEAEHQKQ